MEIALFIHLVSVIVGFGAVVVIDVAGFFWVLNKKSTKDMVNIASITQPLIWLGYIGLVVSGLFLDPNTAKLLTKIKLISVLIIGLNGIFLHFIKQEAQKLGEVKFSKTPISYKLKSILAISISQLAWWSAIIIGFLNATSH